MEKPEFGRPLKNIEHLAEGKMAHLEATLTPVNDPTMKVEWFRNGKPVPQGKIMAEIVVSRNCSKVIYL